jgi:hypothetical protein
MDRESKLDVIRTMQSLSHTFHCANLNQLAVYEVGDMTVNDFIAKYAAHGVRFCYEPSASQMAALALETDTAESEDDSVLDDFSEDYMEISVIAQQQT